MQAHIMHKSETMVWLKMYIDPIRLLHICDNSLLFLVLYEFIVFIMHELDHCKNLLQKRTVTQYCCTALVIFENISNFVVLMHHTFQNEGKLSNSNPIFKPSRCFTCMMTTCYFSFCTDFVTTVITRFFPRLVDLQNPHTEHGTRERTGREAIPAEYRNTRTPHMNKSLAEVTGVRQDQIFLQLLGGSTIPYCTPRPEIRFIGLEICRRTNISVYHQLLTLECHELHTGDNIPPNSTIILRFQPRGGTRSHGRFLCLDVLVSVLQTPTLNTIYERTLRTYMQVRTNWHLQVNLSLEQSQWGRELKTKGNNATAHIEAQWRRFQFPPEVEDSVNTVFELMLCFSANQQTCMAGIWYLWSVLMRPYGVSVKMFRTERYHADSATSRVSANPMGSTPFPFSRAAQS